MRELLIGMVAVGLVAGLAIGRSTERARRTYKDWDAAKTALKKGRGIALGEIRKAAVTVVIIVALLAVVFLAASQI